MTLKVNGEVKQHARTSLMIWNIAEQLTAITEHVTLEPGDILMTGTPSGVGLTTGTSLKPGDQLDAEIDGIGHLVVQIQESTETELIIEKRTSTVKPGAAQRS